MVRNWKQAILHLVFAKRVRWHTKRALGNFVGQNVPAGAVPGTIPSFPSHGSHNVAGNDVWYRAKIQGHFASFSLGLRTSSGLV